MERKRAKYKGSAVNWDNKEKLISKETYIFLTNEGKVQNSDSEVLQQSCLFDPAFNVDSSSSNSGESSSSNEWVNCEDDIGEVKEEKPNLAGMSVMENRKSALGDFIPDEKNACRKESAGNESTRCLHWSNSLTAFENEECQECIIAKNNSEDKNQTDKSLVKSGETNYISYPFINRLVYKSSIEPYFDEELLTGNPQTLLPNISKLHIDGYSESTSSPGYVSESETSVYSEDSTKRAIKSILKRGSKNQTGDRPKKKVRFDLNLPSVDDLSTDINQFPTDTNVKASDKESENEMKTEVKSTELNSHQKCPEETSKEQLVENNLEIYREQCNNLNYFTCKECFPKPKLEDEIIKTPVTVNQDQEKNSLDLLAIEELLEESRNIQKASLESLNSKGVENEVTDPQRHHDSENSVMRSKDTKSFTSIGIQSDQLETDSEKGTCSGYNDGSRKFDIEGNDSELEFKKIHTDSQPTEAEYSSFIKDLVNGSGDRLAKFLMSLSSEISSKSGDEKIVNALMNVGFVQEKNESHDISNTMEKKKLNDNVQLEESNVTQNDREKDEGSVKKINRNGLNSKKRNLLMNNRRSMSEINIHQLKTKEPYYNSFTEKRFHSSRVDQLFIKKTNDDCMWHSLSKNNPNSNGEVMVKLCDIMTELKKNVDKVCRRENTIRIENAQIWLRENKHVEKNMSGDGPRKAIISEKTKETYSQTIESVSMHVGDHIQRQGKREILIVSNSKNEETNVKMNDGNRSTENSYVDSSLEKIESEKSNDDKEIEKRKRFFKENRHLPFYIGYNKKTGLPTLKKGNYEIDVFEKLDRKLIYDINLKSFLHKLADNLNAANDLHSHNKPEENIEGPIRASKSSSTGDSNQEKPVTNLISTFLNRLLKLKINVPAKISNRPFGGSKYWAGTDRLSVIKSFLPHSNREKSFDPTTGGVTGSNDINSLEVTHISSSSIESEEEGISMYEDSWPDVIKTRYPNGMVYFGPLALMPEPPYESNSNEKHSIELETCSCPKSMGCRQYVYNKHMKHMVKASVSRALEQQPDAQMSLEEFSETEEEFYHEWGEMGKV